MRRGIALQPWTPATGWDYHTLHEDAAGLVEAIAALDPDILQHGLGGDR